MRRNEENGQGTAMTFYPRLLTGRQRVGLSWLATCANVVNEELNLLSSGKVVSAILRVIIG